METRILMLTSQRRLLFIETEETMESKFDMSIESAQQIQEKNLREIEIHAPPTSKNKKAKVNLFDFLGISTNWRSALNSNQRKCIFRLNRGPAAVGTKPSRIDLGASHHWFPSSTHVESRSQIEISSDMGIEK